MNERDTSACWTEVVAAVEFLAQSERLGMQPCGMPSTKRSGCGPRSGSSRAARDAMPGAMGTRSERAWKSFFDPWPPVRSRAGNSWARCFRQHSSCGSARCASSTTRATRSPHGNGRPRHRPNLSRAGRPSARLPRHALEIRTESLQQRSLAEQLVEHAYQKVSLHPDARSRLEHRSGPLQRDQVSLVGLHG